MKTKLFHNLLVLALAAGVFAGYASAAPAQNAGTKDKSALVDEAAPAPQAEPANSESKTAKAAPAPSKCEHAAPEKKSDIPVFPIVLSSIGTIAFIVLAIIF